MNSETPFSERLRTLRTSAKLSQAAFAEKLFISRGLLNGLETGREKPSDWIVQQLNMLEKLGVQTLDTINRYPHKDGDSMALEESAEPSREACEAHLRNYLDQAESIPGGIGHTWVQLQLHFSISDLERLKAKKETP